MNEWPTIVNRITRLAIARNLTASPDYIPSNNTDGNLFLSVYHYMKGNKKYRLKKHMISTFIQ